MPKTRRLGAPQMLITTLPTKKPLPPMESARPNAAGEAKLRTRGWANTSITPAEKLPKARNIIKPNSPAREMI